MYLDSIIDHKRQEIDLLLKEVEKNPNHPLHALTPRSPMKLFSKALKGDNLSVIGEVKRRSPSAGAIGAIDDPISLAQTYCRGGASAISVLTDQKFFGGSLEDLAQVSEALSILYPEKAILRKEFILHPIQIAEAAQAGAHAVLLIVAALGKQLPYLLKTAKDYGLETLTEINNQAELDIALEADAPIIGINHRNLKTFQIDLKLSELLRPLIPETIITVAASGIHEPSQARLMRKLGFDAVLVGEALVKASDPAAFISEMRKS